LLAAELCAVILVKLALVFFLWHLCFGPGHSVPVNENGVAAVLLSAACLSLTAGEYKDTGRQLQS